MHYEKALPSGSLKEFVKEYWVFENDDPAIFQQKIIPDGYSEIIIHYGDPYRINLAGQWEMQSSMLFSSQISKYFFLENTGRSGMLGIKLFPTAFYELFQKDVSSITDQVVPLENLIGDKTLALRQIQGKGISISQKISIAASWLMACMADIQLQEKIKRCIDTIFQTHGLIEIDHLAGDVNLSTRQLERLFKKVIGLTPKFYCRIIRFNYIFDVMKEQNDSWIRTALQSGYFDQSHFIKNFKEFTGEEPSSYGFDEVNLANFFLRK